MSVEAKSSGLQTSVAWLIPACTGVGYLLAARYRLGYLEYFGIPSSFLETSITDVLIAAPIILAFAYLQVFDRTKYFFETLCFILFVSLGLARQWNLLEWLASTFTYSCFVWYRYSQDKKPPKGKGQLDKGVKTMAAVIGLGTMLLIFHIAMILAFGIPVAYNIGWIIASSQKDFAVNSEQPQPCAVIQKNGDTYLCVSFDPKTRALTRKFSSVPSFKTLRIERLGKLTRWW